jgi:hypothetical protein
MKKVLKITESQYRKLLLFEQNDIQLPRGYDKPTPSSTTRVDRTNLNYRNIPEFDPFGDKAKTKNEEIRVREGYKYHFMCNRFNSRKPKNSKDPRLTIERHSENCHSCTSELRKYCKSKDMVATLLTEKGSFWDEYFIIKGTSELPINGGHWDNDEYTYCVCMSGEERVIDEDVYFIEEGPVISQGKSVVSDKNTLEKQFIKGRQELYSMNNSSTPLYENFDCSSHREKGEWVNYQQCLTENISMAVSVVPVIGTAASTILDFANGISFLASSLFGEKGEETTNLTMAGISFLSIIPGFGEARALLKMSRKSVIATTDVLKKLEEKQFINMVKGGRYDSALSTLEKLEKSNPYSLAKYGIKNVNKVIDNLKTIGNKDFDKYFTEFLKIVHQYEKGGLKRETLNKLMKKNDFVSLVKKYDDINAAMKSQEFKNMLINIGVQVGFGTGATYLSNYFNNLKKEIENRNFDPEKEKFMIEKLQSYKNANKELEEYIEKKELNTKENNEKVVDYLEIEYKDPETKYEKEIDLDALLYYVESSEEDIKETLTIDETKHNEKRKIKVSESQFKKLFYLNEQEEEEEDICTPKFKQVKLLIKPLVKSYNLSNNEKIVESEYTKNINGETLCRYSFSVKTWDDEELTCIITDNNEYMDSGWILYKLNGKEIASGVYDTSDVKYSYMIFNYKVKGTPLGDDKIFNQFKEILGFYNKESNTQKKINILDKFYTDLKNIDYTKITKNQTNEIYTFLTSNDDCRIYNYSKNVNKLYKKFNTPYLKNNDENTEKESIVIRNILYKKIKNC